MLIDVCGVWGCDGSKMFFRRWAGEPKVGPPMGHSSISPEAPSGWGSPQMGKVNDRLRDLDLSHKAPSHAARTPVAHLPLSQPRK